MHPSASSLSRFGARFAILGAVAISASACSSDRFAYDPFSNPFNGKESGPSMTGSVASGAGPISRAPTSSVTSEPLPAPSGYSSQYSSAAPRSSTYAPYESQRSSYPSAAPAYTPASYPAAPVGKGYGGNGRTIVVQYGDTPYSLGQRHGVPASSILSANKLPQGSVLTPGQRIVIPSSGNQAAANRVMSPAAAPVRTAARSSTGNDHTVASGETLFSIARQYSVPVGQLASANGFGLDQKVREGDSLTIPRGGSTAIGSTATPPRQLGAAPAPLQAPSAAAAPIAQPVEQAAPVAQAAAADEAPKFQRASLSTEDKPATKGSDDDAPRSAGASSGGDFRWPVRGRVISGFGSKPNGATNDGVNLAVPEGTDIKAAESGVVAYAGNELKGFGNLVLIRHQGEWVTAYAHASEILVKRGDVVRRGQVIAKSGKTGNVSAPQLHFEVRRGATPVDPMGHLPAG